MRAFGGEGMGKKGGGERRRRGGNNATIISGNNALIMSATRIYTHTDPEYTLAGKL